MNPADAHDLNCSHATIDVILKAPSNVVLIRGTLNNVVLVRGTPNSVILSAAKDLLGPRRQSLVISTGAGQLHRPAERRNLLVAGIGTQARSQHAN